MVLPQTPQFVLYRTTFEVSNISDKVTKRNGIVLGLSGDSAHITSLTIRATTETSPNTLSISFAIPVTTPGTVQYNDLSTYFFDLKSNQTIWQVMDQIELFCSPTLESVTETGKDGKTITKAREKYHRIFMGIVTSVNTSWDGAFLTINLTAQDLFYWLSLAKIQQKASLYELILRGELEGQNVSTKEKGVLLAYRSKYQGVYIKEIINRILVDPGQEEIRAIFLPETNVTHMWSTLSSFGFASTFIAAQTEKIEKAWTEEYNAKMAGRADPLPVEANSDHIQAVMKQAQIETSGQSVKIDDVIKKGNATMNLEDLVTQRKVREVMAAYWDNEFGRLVRQNYVAFRTVTDHQIVPFPIEFGGPALINGEYRSKLEFLKQLSELTIYEIFQAPQGYIFVKPPLYNAPPLTSISADEIQKVSHDIDADKILTQVTTQGALVLGSGQETTKPESGILVNMPPEFPFIQGTYTYLFPKGFKEDIFTSFKNSFNSIPFVNVTRGYDTYEQFENDYNAIKNKNMPTSFSVADYPTDKDIKDYRRKKALKNSPKSSPEYSPKSPTENSPEDTSKKYSITKNSSIPSDVKDQIFVTAVSTILLANAEKFDRKVQKDRYSEYKHYRGANMNTEYFAMEYAEDFTELIFETLKHKKISFSGSNSERNYIKKVVMHYTTEALKTPSEKDLKPVIPNTIKEITIDLIEHEIIYSKSFADPIKASSKPTATLLPLPADEDKYAKVIRTQFIAIPRSLFNISYQVDSDLSLVSLANLSTGEYNVLQHGLRSTRIDNTLVRTNEGAVAFAQFMMDKNNAAVETTEITLKTLRPDIIPGFPIYNELDSCIYYVNEIEYRVTIGSNIETVLKLIARRRPVWKVADSPPPQSDCNRILEALQTHKPRPEGVFVGTEITNKHYRETVLGPKKNTYLVGWEYIGGNVKVPENAAGGAYSPAQMVPSFGAVIYSFRSPTEDEKKRHASIFITESTENQYCIVFPNEEIIEGASSLLPVAKAKLKEGFITSPVANPIIVDVPLSNNPTTKTLESVKIPGTKFFVPLSYMMFNGASQEKVTLPTIEYAPSDKKNEIKKIVRQWASRGSKNWNPNKIPEFRNSELSEFLAKTNFIMVRSASLTLGTKDDTKFEEKYTVNYYANKYVIVDFIYYDAHEFEDYLKTLLLVSEIQSDLSGIDEKSIPIYVNKYRRTLDTFKETFSDMVVKK